MTEARPSLSADEESRPDTSGGDAVVDLSAHLVSTTGVWAMRRLTNADAPLVTKVAVYASFAVGGGLMARIPQRGPSRHLGAISDEAGAMIRHAAVGAAVSAVAHMILKRLQQRTRAQLHQYAIRNG